ncbi:MAG TPA: carbonic anhydrase family protein [Planctomycetota bacterium]
MNRPLLALALALAASACTSAPKAPAWSYTGNTGPEHWADLSPDYALARSGRRQSPVDIVTSKVVAQSAAPIAASYQATSLEILNNGHTIEDDYHGGGTLTLDGRPYALAQFHFHSPSEHTVDGRHSAMELHLVHKDPAGKLAVIGVLIREGAAHPELAKLWQHLPAQAGRSEAVEGVLVDASKLLPAKRASYRYSGSLTTPPCSEDVSWFVLAEPIEASAEQIAAFRAVIQGNNRPTQPLNGRTIALVQ